MTTHDYCKYADALDAVCDNKEMKDKILATAIANHPEDSEDIDSLIKFHT